MWALERLLEDATPVQDVVVQLGGLQVHLTKTFQVATYKF